VIIPKWYRMRNSVRVIELTNENVEEVKQWIQQNTYYLFNRTNCSNHIHAYTYEPSHREITIHIGHMIIIDELNNICSHSKDTFEKMFYEVGYRTHETEDVLGD
jgi:hypothetical protein